VPRKKPASDAPTTRPAAADKPDKAPPRVKMYAVTVPGPETLILPGIQFHVYGGTLVIMQPNHSATVRGGRPRVFAPGTWLGMEEVE